VRRCHLGEGSGPRPNVVVPGQTDCLITLTWAGGECWGCRQGGVAEAQNADPVRRFPSLQVRPCKLDFDAALDRLRVSGRWSKNPWLAKDGKTRIGNNLTVTAVSVSHSTETAISPAESSTEEEPAAEEAKPRARRRRSAA
jgi:hypothetical protein